VSLRSATTSRESCAADQRSHIAQRPLRAADPLGSQTLAAAQTRETSKVFRRDSKLAVEAAAEPPTAPSDLIRARRDALAHGWS